MITPIDDESISQTIRQILFGISRQINITGQSPAICSLINGGLRTYSTFSCSPASVPWASLQPSNRQAGARPERGMDNGCTHLLTRLDQSAASPLTPVVNESASRQSSDCSSALGAIAYLAATAPWGSSSHGPLLTSSSASIFFASSAAHCRGLLLARGTLHLLHPAALHLGATVTSARFPFPIVPRVLREPTAQSRKALPFLTSLRLRSWQQHRWRQQ